MVQNQHGFDITQLAHDIAEIVDAASAGGRPLANRTFRAIVQARGLTVVESAMLSDKSLNTARGLGIVLWRR